MADVTRGSKEFLDDSYGFLSPYDGETGTQKIMWEGRRKNQYRNWLKGVRSTHIRDLDHSNSNPC